MSNLYVKLLLQHCIAISIVIIRFILFTCLYVVIECFLFIVASFLVGGVGVDWARRRGEGDLRVMWVGLLDFGEFISLIWVCSVLFICFMDNAK